MDTKLTRICTICMEEKALTKANFYRQKRAKHGFKYQCKECTSKKDKSHYEANRDKYIQYAAQYQKTHKKSKAEPVIEPAPMPATSADVPENQPHEQVQNEIS